MVMEQKLMLMVARYVGEWKNCKKNGHGTYTYAHGRSYVGEYKNDDRHGHGTYSDADGIELCCYAKPLSLFLSHVHAIILLLLVLLLLLLYCILLIFYYQLSIIYCSISYNFNNTLFYILNLFKYQLSFIILYRRNFGSFEYV